MEATKKTARIAGALYLIVVLTGIFSLMYVPSQLIVWDNAAVTTSKISAAQPLFRLSIFASIICYTAFLLLPIILYKLFLSVNKTHAVAMVALAVVSVPVSLFNLSNKFAVLTWISKEAYLNMFTTDQIQAQVLLHLNYYDNGIQLASVFWGLWLFPFGYLVFTSGFLPKILGILLMAGCFGYLLNFTGNLLYPGGYHEMGISKFVALPGTIGEIGICLWLLIAGIKNKGSI
jgi:hypothetical protein